MKERLCKVCHKRLCPRTLIGICECFPRLLYVLTGALGTSGACCCFVSRLAEYGLCWFLCGTCRCCESLLVCAQPRVRPPMCAYVRVSTILFGGKSSAHAGPQPRSRPFVPDLTFLPPLSAHVRFEDKSLHSLV